ncbi:MAG: hypothetical protein LC657_12745, partial [Desulfobacteraceae bacterium]|nr:hypothetical protein [Desulfobacteraceae bacterium]
ADIKKAAARVMAAVQDRPTLVFVSRKDACRSQMAAAFAKHIAGKDIRVLSVGIEPARDIDSLAQNFMAQQGIDIKYRLPGAVANLMAEKFTDGRPFQVVCLEPDVTPIPGAKTLFWDLPETPDSKNIAVLGNRIRTRVEALVSDFKGRNQCG